LLRARKDAERDRERLRLLVASLQRSLLPATLQTPPGMATAAHYRMASADEVGGDFYDVFPLGDGRWAFFLGDVCGKGVEAAAVSSAARYTLRAAAVHDPTPAAVLENLNSVLYQDYHLETHRHCTVVFGTLAPSGNGYVATIASGGHPAPLLVRADGTAEYQSTSGGTLIGILPSARVATRTLTLAPGDTLILYSDGLIEARTDAAGGRYSSDALHAFISELGPLSADAAVGALRDLLPTMGGELDDDVAVMALGLPA
jgi:sigma-B regulation protein RsbU (phosphoserine phosphatase)